VYLTQSLHRAAQKSPDGVLSTFGPRRRTAAEMLDRVARLAGALRGLGVQPGDRVAILALNSDRYLEYLYAVPWADAVVNPVNIRWSPPEIVYSFTDSGTSVLFIDDAFAPMLPALREGHPGLRTVIHCGDGPTPEGTLSYEELVASHEPVEDVRRSGDALAGLFYTGGTTGFPKGVMLSHTNMVTTFVGTALSGNIARPGTRFLHAAPMFHIAGLHGLFGTAIAGGTHIFVPMFDPVRVMTAIQEHAVQATLLVPAMIQVLVDHPELATHDLSSLESMTYGASPIPQAVLERAMKALPGTRFVQGYGMTEVGVISVLDGDGHTNPQLLRSAGSAASHAEVRIVDDEGAEVPRGVVGEVTVRGANVMLGYWEKPIETKAALRDGWMHSGDGGFMDPAGNIFIVDRIKDMIVTGGENVYSVEVENVVAKHPAVAACAVIGIPDPEWGEAVHAVVVLKAGAQATPDEIREHAKAHIAGYKAPRSVEFVPALPVSGAGKILKRELRKPHWEGAERQVN
jgi:acyl-CoA synthetase (AMP-forming)/AMP-acid ligase II